jgi:lysophospholipase L1-like esterase
VQTQNSFTVAVTPEPAAAVTAALAPPAVNLGTPATLTWSSLYATACTASGSWTGTQPTSGSLAVSPAGTGVYPYTLSCTGPGGPGSATTTLTVYGAGLPIAAVSPATLNFPFQREGSASTALTVTLTNIGAGTLTGSVVAITGDFSETDTCTGAAVGPKSTCVISVTFSPTNSGTRTGTLTVSGGNAANGSVAVSLSGLGAPPVAAVPLPFISVGLPIYASSAAYPASYANDTSYDTEWQSAVTPTAAAPVTLTLDLSSVSTTLTPNIWAVWYNDDTNSYDHVANGNVGYNNVGAYTLAVNAAPGGTAPPTSGWVNVAGLSGNTLHSFSNLFPFTGYNWIQYTFTASDGSTLNENIGLNLDVYGVANTVTDGWFFCGDSLTADAMGHRSILAEDENNPPNQITIAATSFGQQVNALVGNATPLQENGGVPNFSSANMVTYLPEWLPEIPSKYVTLNLGTNDALGGVAPAAFYANMQTLVQEVIAAGKIPVVPTIPYAVNATIQANLPGLNAEIQALYAAYPSIVPGPDLYTYFLNNPQLISSDQVHPNAQGLAAYRTLWAQFAATHIYATPAVAGTLGAKAVASGSSH